jgi:hypothetical protein
MVNVGELRCYESSQERAFARRQPVLTCPHGKPMILQRNDMYVTIIFANRCGMEPSIYCTPDVFRRTPIIEFLDTPRLGDCNFLALYRSRGIRWICILHLRSPEASAMVLRALSLSSSAAVLSCCLESQSDDLDDIVALPKG